jgi:phage tail-like protein
MPAERKDPLPAFLFKVFLLPSQTGGSRLVAGFSECSGLESTVTLEEYAEGGVNDRVHRFPSRFQFPNLVLRRGITLDPLLRDWHNDLLLGKVKRMDGLVVLCNEAGESILAWKFERGLPVKYSGPALNAGTSAAAIETLEIAYERLQPFGI